jgi:hypothetical protein
MAITLGAITFAAFASAPQVAARLEQDQPAGGVTAAGTLNDVTQRPRGPSRGLQREQDRPFGREHGQAASAAAEPDRTVLVHDHVPYLARQAVADAVDLGVDDEAAADS